MSYIPSMLTVQTLGALTRWRDGDAVVVQRVRLFGFPNDGKTHLLDRDGEKNAGQKAFAH